LAAVAARPTLRRNGQLPKPRSNSVSLADLLAHRFNALSPKHKSVAEFVADNPQFASLSATRQLAERTNVNAATITRFAKALGFSGFHQFQQELRATYLGMLRPDELMKRQFTAPRDVYRAMVMRDVDNLQRVLQTIDTAVLDRVGTLLLGARRTMVLSGGSYAAPGAVLSQLCVALGLNVDLEMRGRFAWAPRLAAMGSKDLLVGISFWRGDPDVVEAVRLASRQGIRTVALADSSVSPLAQAADYRIIVPTEGMLFFQSVTASLSVVYGLVASMWTRAPAGRRAVHGKIRRAFEDLRVFV
jgi:DNA-binding MurR/RpiR family transcriptional regulator